MAGPVRLRGGAVGPPSSSWDMHGGEMGMGNAFGSGSYGMGWCLPRLDEALSALLVDLQGSRLAGTHSRGRRGRIRPHAANQCERRQSGASALADVLFRDHCRRRHSRRNGVWGVRQDRRSTSKTNPYALRISAPRSTTRWVSRSVFVWETTASPVPSARASRSWICSDRDRAAARSKRKGVR